MKNKKRLIDANALIDAIEDIDWYHVNAKGKLVDGANPANNTPIYKAFDIYNAIKNAPTVDAVEVVHGWWDKYEDDKFIGYDANDRIKYRKVYIYYCGRCGRGTAVKTNYCPNCGAKMDGDGNG